MNFKLPPFPQLNALLGKKPEDGAPVDVGAQAAASFQAATQRLPKFIREMLPDVRPKEMSRYLSASIIDKALKSLDRSALIIIGISWFVALSAVGVAFMGVREAAALKVKVDTARALEPVLPKIGRVLLTKEQYDPLVVRLRKQFPTVQFEISPRPSLRIISNKPDEFINWINAVSYSDSMVASVRWSLVNLCVGSECPGEFVMSAEVLAEAINITPSESAVP